MADILPSFALTDQNGREHRFPGDYPAVLCFVKEDCPTCNITMPLIETASRAFQGKLDVLTIGQEASGNARLIERHRLTTPMLDDSELKASFACKIDIVPTVILAD